VELGHPHHLLGVQASMSDGHTPSPQDKRDGLPVNAELLRKLVDGGPVFVPSDEILDLATSQPSVNLLVGSSLRSAYPSGTDLSAWSIKFSWSTWFE
jgi:hypothetical protein